MQISIRQYKSIKDIDIISILISFLKLFKLQAFFYYSGQVLPE